MISRVPPYCMTCVHYQSPFDRTDDDAQKPEPTQICDAFPLPDGIPDEIWWNHVDHRKPVEGDHGIRYQARSGMEFPEWTLEV